MPGPVEPVQAEAEKPQRGRELALQPEPELHPRESQRAEAWGTRARVARAQQIEPSPAEDRAAEAKQAAGRPEPLPGRWQPVRMLVQPQEQARKQEPREPLEPEQLG